MVGRSQILSYFVRLVIAARRSLSVGERLGSSPWAARGVAESLSLVDGPHHSLLITARGPGRLHEERLPEKKERGRLIEINNGRLAMLGLFGFLAESKLPGSVPAPAASRCRTTATGHGPVRRRLPRGLAKVDGVVRMRRCPSISRYGKGRLGVSSKPRPLFVKPCQRSLVVLPCLRPRDCGDARGARSSGFEVEVHTHAGRGGPLPGLANMRSHQILTCSLVLLHFAKLPI